MRPSTGSTWLQTRFSKGAVKKGSTAFPAHMAGGFQPQAKVRAQSAGALFVDLKMVWHSDVVAVATGPEAPHGRCAALLGGVLELEATDLLAQLREGKCQLRLVCIRRVCR